MSRNRRCSRLSLSEDKNVSTLPAPTPCEEEEKFVGVVTKRCIPVDCIPLCPTCRDYSNKPYAKNLGKIFKFLLALVVTAVLASIFCRFFSLSGGIGNERAFKAELIQDKFSKSEDAVNKIVSHVNKQIEMINKQIEGLREEIRRMKGGASTGKGAGPGADSDVRSVVLEELQKYDADKTGLPDFALESLGGCILSTRDTKTYQKGVATVSFLGLPIMNFATDPRVVIQASVTPGECWAFEGSRGSVVIQLCSYALITHITLEHISVNRSPTGEISSAPKDFTLKGLTSVDDCNPHSYGEFTYSVEGPTVQTFEVQKPTPKAYSVAEVTFLSNHGNRNFTCVYRIRVHGKQPKDQD